MQKKIAHLNFPSAFSEVCPMNSSLRVVVASLFLLVAFGCSTQSSFLESKKIDYKSAGQIQPLEIPPDLTSPSADDRFSVPDGKGPASATLSNYDGEKKAGSTDKTAKVLPTNSKIKIERDGSQRWLKINMPAEELWLQVKDFWQESGFILKVDAPEAGVMETDWAENRAKIPQDIVRSTIGKVFDGLYSTGERDKFRTRLERGKDANTTEVYITHRGMQEIYTSELKKDTRWQPRKADVELEAEMLLRLANRLGSEDARAQADAVPKAEDRAKLVKAGDGKSQLNVLEDFERAWRRVGLALDRVGFTVDDRDRSKGVYFVSYVDPQDDNKVKPKGFFARLFGRGDSKPGKQEQYRIFVGDAGESTAVRVQDKVGNPEKTPVGDKILDLLYSQLK
jgi:outer membrane protein assembly factor BamC